MSVENNSARDLAGRPQDALLDGQVGMFAAGQVAVDVLDHDDRTVHDNAEVHGADRQQIGRLAAGVQHRKGEQQRQRNVQGHDQRRTHVRQKHEQNGDDQQNADEQVLLDGLGRDGHQLGAVVVRLDLDAGQHFTTGRVVQLLNLLADVLQRRQRMLVLAQQDNALDLVALVAPENFAIRADDAVNAGGSESLPRPVQTDPAQARLIADHNAADADRIAGLEPASLDNVLQKDVLVVDGGEDQLANLEEVLAFLVAEDGGRRGGQAAALGLAQLAQAGTVRFLGLLQLLLGDRIGIAGAQHQRHRIETAADQADAANVHGDVALVEEATAGVGVGGLKGGLDLSEGDAEAP